MQAPLIRDAVKASVPKLFSCPGASASSPSREFSAERRFSATQKTYNTVGSRLLRRKPARFRGFPPCAQSKNISLGLPLWQEPVSSATAHQAKTIAARRLGALHLPPFPLGPLQALQRRMGHKGGYLGALLGQGGSQSSAEEGPKQLKEPLLHAIKKSRDLSRGLMRGPRQGAQDDLLLILRTDQG